jgi:transcriptional regulator with PAS, ATPase and Fis domain
VDISTLWIVVEPSDAGIALPLGEAGLADEIVAISPAEWFTGNIPYGTPDAILFDVRSEAAWSQVSEWAVQRRDSELASIPWLAIVGESIPLQWALEADQTFTGFVSLPMAAVALQQTITLARQRLVARGREHWGESRSLHGTSHVFRTFEPSLFPVIEQLKRAASSDFTVLLIAETGTGKSTLAQIIHENSQRETSRFLAVPCASLPRELIESELFGHVKGAFTGAEKNKEGKFDVAKGGTILLDEIDALEMMQQAKMLRVLETGEYEPVGSNDTRVATARCVVASNVCLEKLVAEGRFRQDLFYRLNQLKFEIPPLRQRLRDVIPLAVELIARCSEENRLEVRGLDPVLFDSMLHYAWPGNIRELRNELRRCVLFAQDGIVRSTDLSESILAAVAKMREKLTRTHSATGLAGNVALTEQQAIEEMLRNQKFNRAATARALGISRVTLYNKLRRYNIQIDEKDDEEEN